VFITNILRNMQQVAIKEMDVAQEMEHRKVGETSPEKQGKSFVPIQNETFREGESDEEEEEPNQPVERQDS
jgi:hypothetical protein